MPRHPLSCVYSEACSLLQGTSVLCYPAVTCFAPLKSWGEGQLRVIFFSLITEAQFNYRADYELGDAEQRPDSSIRGAVQGLGCTVRLA